MDIASVRLYVDQHVIVVRWKSRVSVKDFKEVYHQVLRAFKMYFVNTLIIDNGEECLPNDNCMQWLGEDVLPLASKCGLRALLCVSTNKQIIRLFNQFPLNGTSSKKRNYTVDVYPEIELAYQKINFQEVAV